MTPGRFPSHQLLLAKTNKAEGLSQKHLMNLLQGKNISRWDPFRLSTRKASFNPCNLRRSEANVAETKPTAGLFLNIFGSIKNPLLSPALLNVHARLKLMCSLSEGVSSIELKYPRPFWNLPSSSEAEEWGGSGHSCRIGGAFLPLTAGGIYTPSQPASCSSLELVGHIRNYLLEPYPEMPGVEAGSFCRQIRCLITEQEPVGCVVSCQVGALKIVTWSTSFYHAGWLFNLVTLAGAQTWRELS